MNPVSAMAAVAAILLLGAAPSWGDSSTAPRIALKGYDPVAYFTERKPLKGDSQIAHDWDDSRYYFASARHRELFAADPDRYAPRFSGFCTGAVLKGERYEANPDYWAIVDGKLYVFSSRAGKERFEQNPAIELAEKAWRQTKSR